VIALDAMGGDKGVAVNLEGALMAVADATNLKVILVGRECILEEKLKKQFIPPEIEILHAEDVIEMDDPATKSLRRHETSIAIGMKLMIEGKADGFVSIGNTGAVVANALVRLGRIPGIERPALATLFPTERRKPALVLDVGASIECKPEQLTNFAIMGNVYAKEILGIDKPRVALLSNGEEASKGTSAVKEANRLINAIDGINFIGNIEGRGIVTGQADVVVTDGFTGNILLKFAESTFRVLKRSFMKGKALSLRLLLGGFMLLPTLKGIMRDYDYREYGGAPLLGINGNVIIGHGRSSPQAIENAILLSQKMALAQIHKKIEKTLRARSKDEGKGSGNRVQGSRESSYQR